MKKKVIMFEQQGKDLFEGILNCDFCGYNGKATLNIALAHKQGYHNIGSRENYSSKTPLRRVLSHNKEFRH